MARVVLFQQSKTKTACILPRSSLATILFCLVFCWIEVASSFPIEPSSFCNQSARTLDFSKTQTRTSKTSTATTTTTTSTCLAAMASSSPMETMSKAVSDALGRKVELVPTSGGGASGGGGATTSAVIDKISGAKYFVKSARNKFDMLMAEYLGVDAMAKTNTIQVPTPIACGQHKDIGQAFAIFEYLDFCGGGSQFELGVQLAKMHRHVSEDGFGFHVDNTIGATHQPNIPWMDNWVDFWLEHRLGHMLRLTRNAGYDNKKIEELKEKTKELISHNPAPSLLHGDLWGGNKGFCKKDGKIIPVIFDPATYYGDREADIAMTYLFGGFNSDFYKGYESEWPLPEGHEKRRTVYNLYHILNHEVLFGGYIGQARSMIENILRM